MKDIVDEIGTDNWKEVASHFADRTDVQCLGRWQKVLNPELVKGPWTKEVRRSDNVCHQQMYIIWLCINHYTLYILPKSYLCSIR